MSRSKTFRVRECTAYFKKECTFPELTLTEINSKRKTCIRVRNGDGTFSCNSLSFLWMLHCTCFLVHTKGFQVLIRVERGENCCFTFRTLMDIVESAFYDHFAVNVHLSANKFENIELQSEWNVALKSFEHREWILKFLFSTLMTKIKGYKRLKSQTTLIGARNEIYDSPTDFLPNVTYSLSHQCHNLNLLSCKCIFQKRENYF